MAFADDFKLAVQRALRIVQLQRDAIAAVAADPGALAPGVAIVAIAGAAGAIGAFDPLGLFYYPLVMVAVSFVWVGILFVVGLLFRPPRWDYLELYRPLSHLSLLNWASVVPFLGPILGFFIGLYQIVVTVVVIESVGHTTRTNAILIVLIPVVVCCCIPLLVGAFFFSAALLALLPFGRS